MLQFIKNLVGLLASLFKQNKTARPNYMEEEKKYDASKGETEWTPQDC